MAKVSLGDRGQGRIASSRDRQQGRDWAIKFEKGILQGQICWFRLLRINCHRISRETNDLTLSIPLPVLSIFAMPWVVATGIAKVLEVRGILFVGTHFSWSSHERPWHFHSFQFSDMALKTLFSNALAFECLEAGMSNPMIGRHSFLAEGPLRWRPIEGLFCCSEYLGRKIRGVESFDWNAVGLGAVVGDTRYPNQK